MNYTKLQSEKILQKLGLSPNSTGGRYLCEILIILFNNTYKEDCILQSSHIVTSISDDVIRYLADHPEEFYHLSNFDFEIIMAEIYRRLGYDVYRTPSTHDGGKDIILIDHTELGDFIYYVECKNYIATKPVGIATVRQLNGVIVNDNVNGGIIATTSYFSNPAKKFIMDNNEYRIKMHNFKYIQSLLQRIIS